MFRDHQVEPARIDGFDAIRLVSSAHLAATFVPGAGMVCCSLTHRGEELLGQRRGVRVYAERGSTMGIPILHPWANRLGRLGFSKGGVEVSFVVDLDVAYFIDGKQNSYKDILKAAQFTYFGYDWGMDALRVVDGELDNKYKPSRTPITVR